jgi:predicted negative regulator of RcsB-dependent stress response
MALDVMPKSLAALELSGDAAMRRKKYKAALKSFRKALKTPRLRKSRKRRLIKKARRAKRLAR